MFLKGKIRLCWRTGAGGRGGPPTARGCGGKAVLGPWTGWPRQGDLFVALKGWLQPLQNQGTWFWLCLGDTPQWLSHLIPEGGRPRKSTRKACAGLPSKRQAWWLPWREEAERKPCPWTPSGNWGEPQSRPHRSRLHGLLTAVWL